MARFDWYQATVRADVGVVRECLRSLNSGGQVDPIKKAPHGYAFGDRLLDDDGLVAQVWWGGMHAHPHVVSSGESAQAVAQLLRAELPDHSVSRADACIDYADAGAYDRLQGLALDVAKARKLVVDCRGDHLVTLEARTLYLGAPSSHTRLRLYDKAAELRAQFARDPVRLAAVPAELARLEFQVRPQTPKAKRLAAEADPVTIMGSAAWTRELMRQVAGMEIEPFEAGKAWRRSDHERARAAILAQYGGWLKAELAMLGSWDCVGLQLGHDLAEREQAAVENRRRGVR